MLTGNNRCCVLWGHSRCPKTCLLPSRGLFSSLWWEGNKAGDEKSTTGNENIKSSPHLHIGPSLPMSLDSLTRDKRECPGAFLPTPSFSSFYFWFYQTNWLGNNPMYHFPFPSTHISPAQLPLCGPGPSLSQKVILEKPLCIRSHILTGKVWIGSRLYSPF